MEAPSGSNGSTRGTAQKQLGIACSVAACYGPDPTAMLQTNTTVLQYENGDCAPYKDLQSAG